MLRSAQPLVPRVLGAAAIALLFAACSEHSVTAPAVDALSARLIVSAPVGRVSTLSASVTNAGRSAPSRNDAASTGGSVYISLVPGSVAGGYQATIRNLATGQSLTVTVVNGGFDPVPIAANVGDELIVEVRSRAGALLVSTSIKVPPRRPPTIVRSDPPNGKTDVPLNTRIEVVFSEPVDSTTVASSLQLSLGGSAVSGSSMLDGAGLIATFAPDSPLARSANYTLTITAAIHSLAGDPLEHGASIDFTTDNPPVGLPPEQSISECPADSPLTSTAFERVGSMTEGRRGVATLLPDGRVLIFGGTLNAEVRPRAEIYDPVTRVFAAADQMITTLEGHPAVMLPEGKLLFLDGIVLQDGRVFFAAPASIYLQLQNGPFSPPNYAEIYDPTSGMFSRLQDYGTTGPVTWDTATLLQDGRVLLTGSEGSATDFTNRTELFDPRTNTFKRTGAMQGWYDTSGWGTLLADGTVLFVQWCFDACNDAVELYDPSTESFTVVGSINGDLSYSRAVLLVDGRVLISGGQLPGGKGTNETLLYLPRSRTLVLGQPMACGRDLHSATLLSDGTVLIAGGYSTWPGPTPTAEIFHPPAQ